VLRIVGVCTSGQCFEAKFAGELGDPAVKKEYPLDKITNIGYNITVGCLRFDGEFITMR